MVWFAKSEIRTRTYTYMKKLLLYILFTILAFNLSPNVYGDVTDHIFVYSVIVCDSEKLDCNVKVPDSPEFIYSVITVEKRFDNLSKKGNVYRNKDGETFTFTGEYLVLKDVYDFVDGYDIPTDDPVVIGTPT